MAALAGIAAVCAVVFWKRTPPKVTPSEFVPEDGLISASQTKDHAEFEPNLGSVPDIQMPPVEEPISDQQWLATQHPDRYSPPPGTFSGYTLDMFDGRFVCHYFSDVISNDSGAMTVKGRYTIDGNRLFLHLHGHNSTANAVLVIRQFDGVTVLLSPQAVMNDLKDGHPTSAIYGEILVLKPTPEKYDNGAWWHELLQTHPKFAKWCRP